MPLPKETSLEDVQLRIRQSYSNPNVGNITQAILKDGPQVFKIATLLEINDPKTKSHHHYSLKIDHIRKTNKEGWFTEPERSTRLEGKTPDEIKNLYVFLSAVFGDELKDKVGDIHIVTGVEYQKLEDLIEAIPNVADSDKLQLMKTILSQVDGANTDVNEFATIFGESDGTALKHIAAASRMVEYTAAYEELKQLVDNPSTSEAAFQKHLEKHPWMFGSEYSELLRRRHWTRDENLDYMLRRTVDGYLEIIEIKTAFSEPLFLHDRSHDSYYPSAKLSPVIGQVTHYIEEVERNRNSIIAHDNADPLKIRARAIVGRDGDDDHQAALRNFNAHLYRIEVLTYDQLLRIARRVLDMFGGGDPDTPETDDEDVPF